MGTRHFIVNYHPGSGRKVPSERIVIGRYGRGTPEEGRKKTHCMPGCLVDFAPFSSGITEATGTRSRFHHGLHNALITATEREPMLLHSTAKRPVNHARPSVVTAGDDAESTAEQPRMVFVG